MTVKDKNMTIYNGLKRLRAGLYDPATPAEVAAPIRCRDEVGFVEEIERLFDVEITLRPKDSERYVGRYSPSTGTIVVQKTGCRLHVLCHEIAHCAHPLHNASCIVPDVIQEAEAEFWGVDLATLLWPKRAAEWEEECRRYLTPEIDRWIQEDFLTNRIPNAWFDRLGLNGPTHKAYRERTKEIEGELST